MKGYARHPEKIKPARRPEKIKPARRPAGFAIRRKKGPNLFKNCGFEIRSKLG